MGTTAVPTVFLAGPTQAWPPIIAGERMLAGHPADGPQPQRLLHVWDVVRRQCERADHACPLLVRIGREHASAIGLECRGRKIAGVVDTVPSRFLGVEDRPTPVAGTNAWREIALPAPLAVTAGLTYTVTYDTNGGSSARRRARPRRLRRT